MVAADYYIIQFNLKAFGNEKQKEANQNSSRALSYIKIRKNDTSRALGIKKNHGGLVKVKIAADFLLEGSYGIPNCACKAFRCYFYTAETESRRSSCPYIFMSVTYLHKEYTRCRQCLK